MVSYSWVLNISKAGYSTVSALVFPIYLLPCKFSLQASSLSFPLFFCTLSQLPPVVAVMYLGKSLALSSPYLLFRELNQGCSWPWWGGGTVSALSHTLCSSPRLPAAEPAPVCGSSSCTGSPELDTDCQMWPDQCQIGSNKKLDFLRLLHDPKHDSISKQTNK